MADEAPTENALVTAEKQRGRPFQKGLSGNPNGRPKKTPELLEVETLCREMSPAAVKNLKRWMRSDNPKASVSASMGILDRAFGKAKQQHTVEHSASERLLSLIEAGVNRASQR